MDKQQLNKTIAIEAMVKTLNDLHVDSKTLRSLLLLMYVMGYERGAADNNKEMPL